MTLPSPSLSSSSNRCLLVAMVTSPSVPPYGEAGRLEDILEKKKEDGKTARRENSERCSTDAAVARRLEVRDGGVCGGGGGEVGGRRR